MAMIDILRQLSEPELRWQTEIEKSQTAIERDILICRVRKSFLTYEIEFVLFLAMLKNSVLPLG